MTALVVTMSWCDTTFINIFKYIIALKLAIATFFEVWPCSAHIFALYPIEEASRRFHAFIIIKKIIIASSSHSELWKSLFNFA